MGAQTAVSKVAWSSLMLVLGILVGLGGPHLGRRAQVVPASSASSVPPLVPVAETGTDLRLLTAMMGQLLSRMDALESSVRSANPAIVPSVPKTKDTPAENTPHLAEQEHAVRTLITNALKSHEWREEDAAAIQASFRSLPAEQRYALRGELIDAINSGQLRVTAQGMPF